MSAPTPAPALSWSIVRFKAISWLRRRKDEHLADEVFGDRFVADEAQNEPVNVDVVPGEQSFRRQLIALGDAREQIAIRALARRDLGLLACDFPSVRMCFASSAPRPHGLLD